MSDETKGTPRGGARDAKGLILRSRTPQPARAAAAERAAARASAARPAAAARGLTYKDAGVDIGAKSQAIQRIKMIARGTFRKGVLSDIGSVRGPHQQLARGPLAKPPPVHEP